MRYTSCPQCHVAVALSIEAATGNTLRLDPIPTSDGNVLVDGFGRAHTFRSAGAALAFQEARPGTDIAAADQHRRHAVTCAARRGNEQPQLEPMDLAPPARGNVP